MKNFLDLLDTDFTLDIVVNGENHTANLQDTLVFKDTDTVIIDGIEILPKYHYFAVNGQLIIDKPFYQWYHSASDQGWLLTPH